jgi:hypothetical protein
MLKYLSTPLGIYFMWIVLHYISPHLYTYFCTPSTAYGFFMSPFMAPTPHCSALRWVMYTGGNTITAMWVLIGGWIVQRIIIQKEKSVSATPS